MALARSEYVEAMRSRALRIDSTPREDHFVWLFDSSWTDYERLLEWRGEKALPRITYLEGTIEVMRPSFDHARIKSTFARLVEVYCTEREIDWSACGSFTEPSASTVQVSGLDEIARSGGGTIVKGDAPHPFR